MPKMAHFGEFLKTWSLRSNSVTRQVSFNRTKIGGKCQNSKNQMRHFWQFSNSVLGAQTSFRLSAILKFVWSSRIFDFLHLGNCCKLSPYTTNKKTSFQLQKIEFLVLYLTSWISPLGGSFRGETSWDKDK